MLMSNSLRNILITPSASHYISTIILVYTYSTELCVFWVPKEEIVFGNWSKFDSLTHHSWIHTHCLSPWYCWWSRFYPCLVFGLFVAGSRGFPLPYPSIYRLGYLSIFGNSQLSPPSHPVIRKLLSQAALSSARARQSSCPLGPWIFPFQFFQQNFKFFSLGNFVKKFLVLKYFCF